MISEADKMFKKLKFKKRENKIIGYIEYVQEGKNEDAVISFDRSSQTIMAGLYKKTLVDAMMYGSRGLAITPEELKATYKKCEELGWIK